MLVLNCQSEIDFANFSVKNRPRVHYFSIFQWSEQTRLFAFRPLSSCRSKLNRCCSKRKEESTFWLIFEAKISPVLIKMPGQAFVTTALSARSTRSTPFCWFWKIEKWGDSAVQSQSAKFWKSLLWHYGWRISKSRTWNCSFSFSCILILLLFICFTVSTSRRRTWAWSWESQGSLSSKSWWNPSHKITYQNSLSHLQGYWGCCCLFSFFSCSFLWTGLQYSHKAEGKDDKELWLR